jgi:hypothetical protein
MDRDKEPGKTITVIGGPSAWQRLFPPPGRERQVLIIEKNDILGEAAGTGNGRCNLTNTNCPDAEDTIPFLTGLAFLPERKKKQGLSLFRTGRSGPRGAHKRD